MPYIDYIPVCASFPKDGFNTITLKTDTGIAGIKISVSPANGENQSVEIIGRDETYLLYAVADFKNIYLPFARCSFTSCGPYYFKTLFSNPLKSYEYSSAPKIEQRGLWLWGHTVLDFRRFIDNMVDLKLNTLILWNDFPPVNIGDVIAYAHENGVLVYLGFAWGWDTKMPDVITEDYLNGVAKAAVSTYNSQYVNIDCDGIYFQTFTENMPDNVSGVSVAERAVSLVNTVGNTLLKEKPDLKILFGLHAGCALNNLDKIADVDPRISIIWEDVGAFPYHYIPTKTENFEKTLENTRRIRDLRSGGFGTVLKGVICLDWGRFEHQQGCFWLGGYDRNHIKIKADEKREILRFIQASWIKNARYAQDIIREYKKDSLITCLVEDGAFEELVNFPTAVYASLLWDSDRDIGDILYEVSLRPDVDFV